MDAKTLSWPSASIVNAVMAALILIVGCRGKGRSQEPRSPEAAASRAPAIILREDIFTSAPFAQCHASTIVETESGLVAAWFGGTKEGNPDVGIWLSRRDESAWSPPVEVVSGRQAGKRSQPCWNPVLVNPEGGPLILFYKLGPSPSRWRGMMTVSDDGGLTWAEPRSLPDGMIGPVKNHPLEFPDGTLLCGSSTERDGWRVHFEFTPDKGRTWRRTPPINDGRDVGLIQPALLRHGAEGVISLMRSTAGRVYFARSGDRGAAWSNPEPLDLPNPNSGIDAVTLRDGRHVLVYNPVSSGRTPLAVAVSPDGHDWKQSLILEDERGAEFSYPAVIQAADGMVHVTYTWKRLRIRHVVIDTG
jgi:predicted neuraminidase